MRNRQEVIEELNNIHLTYDFSDECSTEIKNYILRHNLAYYDEDDILFLSASGEMAIGYDDRGVGSPDEDITESFFYNDGSDDDY